MLNAKARTLLKPHIS